MGDKPKPEPKPPQADQRPASPEGVAAVLLAAGMSRRFEARQTKQLLSLDGETLVHRALRLVLEASDGTNVVCVVLGHAAQEVRAAIDDLLLAAPHVVCLHNSDYARGQSTSVRRAIQYLQDVESVSGAYFLPVDQPWMEVALLRRLVAAHGGQAARTGGAKIVVPTHGRRRGSPVLFDRAFFTELQKLEGDEGGRQLLRRHPDQIHFLELETEAPLRDIDTLEDLEGRDAPPAQPTEP